MSWPSPNLALAKGVHKGRAGTQNSLEELPERLLELKAKSPQPLPE